MNEENKYYVYAYIDPYKDEFIYIGTGSGARVDSHLYPSVYNLDRNESHPFYIYIRELMSSGDVPERIILRDGLTKKQGLALEEKLILQYGRKIFNNGTLLNISTGGGNKMIQCPRCGWRTLIGRRNIGIFLKSHFENCKYCKYHVTFDGRNLEKSTPDNTDLTTSTGKLMSECSNIEEYLIRREFYGYSHSELTGGEVGDFYGDLVPDFSPFPKPTNDNPSKPSIPPISDELFEYSLKGLSSIRV